MTTATHTDAPASAAPIPDEDEMLALPDVRRHTKLSTSTIYRLMAAKRFPRPLQLSPGTVRWLRSDLSIWQQGLQRVR